MHAANTVQLDSHAAATLRYIRSSMESAASLAVPGSTGFASGIVGLLAAVAASIPALQPYWLIVWLIAAVIAASVGGVLLFRQTPFRRFAIGLLPCPMTMLILTFAIAHATLVAGLVLTLFLGIGIAATIALVGTLGVVARLGIFARLDPSGRGYLIALNGFQIVSCIAIVVLGAVFLPGHLP